MPYSIEPKDGQFVVVSDSGETMGVHPTRAQAIAQQRALYASVPDASVKEISHGHNGVEFPKEIVDLINAAINSGDEAGIKANVNKGIAWVKEKQERDEFYDNDVPISGEKERKPSIIDRVLNIFKEGRRNSSGDSDRLQQIHDLAVANGASCPMVFKEARGRLRWVLFSSNSFQDTDRQYVSQAALDRDVARTDKERNYGPLRWWHVGNPDRLTRTPGDGIDLGDCDFRAMHGRMLIESGTFRNERIGEAIKERADTLAGSIGFFHPLSQPDTDGVFTDIHTFERSLLPRGRASNPLTALTVTKESSDMATMKEKLDEFVALLGGDKQLAESVVKRAEQTEKEAAEAGLKFKENESQTAPVTEAAPVADVVTEKATKKAAKKTKVKKGKGGAKKGGGKSSGSGSDDQTKAMFARLEESGERTSSKEAMEIEDDAETEVDADEIFDALKEDIGAMIDERLAALGKERTEKEAGLTAQIETLAAKLKEADAKLAILNSDMPRGVRAAYRASQDPATINTNTATLKEMTAPANGLEEIFAWLASPTPTPQ